MQRLHLELTSKCLLSCPSCPRTIHKGHYKIKDMPLQYIDRLDGERVFEHILVCGNHGDAIYHAQFHEVIIRLQKMKGSPSIAIATNGSHRDANWWRKTAEILRPQDMVIFGIDGLADTNHVYRVGARWPTIVTAMETLKQYGVCRVVWQWILFRYNQNQLGHIMQQARQWGVDEVTLVESFRDLDGYFSTDMNLNEAMAVVKNE